MALSRIDGQLGHAVERERPTSSTQRSSRHYRVMPICANMGQAASIAAALCVQQGCAPRNLKVADLQAVLRQQGVEP